jgi:FkbM family methyltransferase
VTRTSNAISIGHSSAVPGAVPGKNARPTPRRWVRRAVARVCQQLGFELVPTWRASTLEQCRHLHTLLDQLEIDTVLDVGANVGGFWNLLRTYVGYGGRIISFEPVQDAFEALRAATRGDAAWSGWRVALSDNDGELSINVAQRSTMSSFLQRDESMLRSSGYDHLLNVTRVLRTELVMARTLDSLSADLFDHAQAPRIFLKVDTQGYDLKVITGATRLLPHVLAIQIELSIKPLYEGAPAYAAVLEHLTGLGFDITGVFPVRRDELWRVLNFDCVLINSHHPSVQRLAAGTVRGRTPEQRIY